MTMGLWVGPENLGYSQFFAKFCVYNPYGGEGESEPQFQGPETQQKALFCSPAAGFQIQGVENLNLGELPLAPCRRGGGIILKIPKISQPSACFRYNLHQFLQKISVKILKHSRRLRRATIQSWHKMSRKIQKFPPPSAADFLKLPSELRGLVVFLWTDIVQK